MRTTDDKAGKAAHIYQDLFETAFETLDMTSSLWQPLLKAVGRTQMELAGFQARQGQAFIQWAHSVTQPVSPFDVMNANMQFWRTMTDQCTDVVPRVAAAIETAAQAAVAPTPFRAPAGKGRDTLILIDRDGEAKAA